MNKVLSSEHRGRKLIAGGLIVAVGYLGIGKVVDGVSSYHLPGFPHPHLGLGKVTTKEGLSSVIAQELVRTKEFKGATRTYAVTTSIEKSKNYLIGSDTDTGTISTIGEADAGVDFSSLTASDIDVSPDNKTVTIRVPNHAKAEDVRASHEKGLLTIVHTPNVGCMVDNCHLVSDEALLQQADKKVADVVNHDSDLITTAETQTTEFLSGIVNGVGLQLLHNQNAQQAPDHIDVSVSYGLPGSQAVQVKAGHSG